MKSRAEIEAMPDYDRRVETAKLCGLELRTFAHGGGTSYKMWVDQNGVYGLPNYPTDLNACHRAESIFEPVDNVMLCREYIKNLCSIVEVDTDMERWSFIQDFILLHATGRQRNTAFLMTLMP